MIIFLLLSLCSCEKHKTIACERLESDRQIYLDIEADYDDIRTVSVNEVFVIPYSIIANERSMIELRKQLDDSYHFEDNRLIRFYQPFLDDIYSLSETIAYLRDLNYVCR